MAGRLVGVRHNNMNLIRRIIVTSSQSIFLFLIATLLGNTAATAQTEQPTLMSFALPENYYSPHYVSGYFSAGYVNGDHWVPTVANGQRLSRFFFVDFSSEHLYIGDPFDYNLYNAFVAGHDITPLHPMNLNGEIVVGVEDRTEGIIWVLDESYWERAYFGLTGLHSYGARGPFNPFESEIDNPYWDQVQATIDASLADPLAEEEAAWNAQIAANDAIIAQRIAEDNAAAMQQANNLLASGRPVQINYDDGTSTIILPDGRSATFDNPDRKPVYVPVYADGYRFEGIGLSKSAASILSDPKRKVTSYTTAQAIATAEAAIS
jgi:hypothetical protein